jgi:hypothetical protein
MRILRSTTISKLHKYIDATLFSFPKNKNSESLKQAIISFSKTKEEILNISKLLFSCLGEEESKKLLSKVTTYFNRHDYGKVALEVNKDTKALIDKKKNNLNYDSIDELIHDALSEFQT